MKQPTLQRRLLASGPPGSCGSMAGHSSDKKDGFVTPAPYPGQSGSEHAINLGHNSVIILEFTCAFNISQHKKELYRLHACLWSVWSVQIMPFSLVTDQMIRGSFSEQPWTAALSSFSLQDSKAANLLTQLVSLCLVELNKLFSPLDKFNDLLQTDAVLAHNAKQVQQLACHSAGAAAAQDSTITQTTILTLAKMHVSVVTSFNKSLTKFNEALTKPYLKGLIVILRG